MSSDEIDEQLARAAAPGTPVWVRDVVRDLVAGRAAREGREMAVLRLAADEHAAAFEWLSYPDDPGERPLPGATVLRFDAGHGIVYRRDYHPADPWQPGE